MTRYLRFLQQPTPGLKTFVWDVVSATTNDFLGMVRWRNGWRRYVFEPEPRTSFDVACLGEVTAFIQEQMAARSKP